MADNTNLEYDSTFTVRVDKATKDRFLEVAEAMGISFSQCIRDFMQKAKSPDELLLMLDSRTRARVEKLAQKQGKDAGMVLLGLIPRAIPVLLDTISHGV